jgi:hypothetical protein
MSSVYKRMPGKRVPRIVDELRASLMKILRCLGIGFDCLLKEVADNVGGALKPNNAKDNEGVV